jgi:protein kinase
MEKASNDLGDLGMQNVRLDASQIKYVLREIAQGLKYLHEDKKILHRDIKPANILVYQDGSIKIADFNHSIDFKKLVDSKWKGQIGTDWFRPPELILEYPYFKQFDVWSLGCIFEYLLTGEYGFRFKSTKEVP